MNDWNPDLYLQFNSERTKPSIDLIGRIIIDSPESIIDIGCGPGNSTQILLNQWPESKITGLDNSPSMIKKARKDYPDQEWIVADALTYKPKAKFDIVFSNAVIQWIPDHGQLLKRFHGIIKDKGLLAVQIPLFWNIPLGKIIARTARDQRWNYKTEKVSDLFTIHDSSFYYDELWNLFNSLEMWETDYIHIMDSHMAILEMIRSTGLKPYLEKLDKESEKKDFEEEVLKEIKIAYPVQKNNKVLLPFKRLFFIGYK